MLWRLADELPVALAELSPDGEVLVTNVRAREVLEGPGRAEVQDALRRVCARAHRTGGIAEQALSIGRIGEVRLVAVGGGARILVSIELSQGTRLRTEVRVLREYLSVVADPAPRGGTAQRLLQSLASALVGSGVGFYLVEDDAARLQATAGMLPSPSGMRRSVTLAPADSSVARAIAAGVPVFVHSLAASPLPADVSGPTGQLAGLAVPVRAEGSVRGALWVVGPPHLLGEGELRLVQGLTDALAETLWRASRESALASERRKARELVDDLQDALVEVDARGVVVRAGGNTRTVFGRDPPDLVGAPLSGWFEAPSLATALAGGRGVGQVLLSVPVTGPGGRQLRCAVDRIGADDDGTVRLVVRDLTERLELEEKLRREREAALRERQLATVGRLAAGVAHEVNNPLTYVRANLQHLRERLARDPLPREGLDVPGLVSIVDESLDGVDRIGGIVLALKGMSRDRMRDWRLFDVHEPIEHATTMFRSTRSGCSVDVAVGRLPWVEGSPGALTQVVLNLLSNGADAMGGDGRLRITGEAVRNEVTIAVTDEGPGFSDEAKSRLFEPFFTTKTGGRGTGLGLHVSRQLVGEMRGRLEVRGKPGANTVLVTLPAAKDQP